MLSRELPRAGQEEVLSMGQCLNIGPYFGLKDSPPLAIQNQGRMRFTGAENTRETMTVA